MDISENNIEITIYETPKFNLGNQNFTMRRIKIKLQCEYLKHRLYFNLNHNIQPTKQPIQKLFSS
jgi:hypothetical protein